MRVAFYAPMKSPDHPVPSGDRAMGRALMAALRTAGAEVTLASDLRLYDGAGDSEAQAHLAARAEAEVRRLTSLPDVGEWRVWITYHNYYKAPDLVGPEVARALRIPYLQIESTRASKRLHGPWARFAKAAEAAADAAHGILYFTQHDAEALRSHAVPGQILVHLPPFLDRDGLPAASPLGGPMLCVGMMRAGDKLASYRLIAETLAQLDRRDWRLDVAGDGPAAAEVRALLAPFGDRVRVHGAMGAHALAGLYRQAGLLLWPGVNEAFGMVYLEAQAAGVPVVAQDRPGVRDVVSGTLVDPAAGPHGMAARLATLLDDPQVRARAGAEAREKIARHHLLPHAAEVIGRVLHEVAP